MKRLLALALLLIPVAALAADFSVTLTTTPVQVMTVQTRRYLRMINVEPAGGASAWCSRSLTTTLAANAPGAYELQPGGSEEFAIPGFVPNEAEWCVAASATVRLTAEAN